MTYVVTKYIKGNPYLYEVKSVREGDRVRQVFVRYLGRADKPGREYSETEPVERKERIRRPAVAAVSEAVTPTVAVEAETPAPVERTGQEMRSIRDRLQGERMGWQVPQSEFISIESEVSGSPITPDFSESMVDTHKSLIQRAIREGEDVPADVLKDYPELSPKPAPMTVETTPTPVTKEPWEMTKAERATHIEQKGKEAIQKWNESGSKGFPPSNPERWGVSEVNKAADELGMPWGEGRVAIPQHKYEVMVALKQGKPIPPEVLKDYPELAEKPIPPTEEKIEEITPESLGQKHGIEVEVIKGQEGGEWAGGVARVGDDTNLVNYKAGDWTSAKTGDFISQKQYPSNVVSAAHEIAHGLFTKNLEQSHKALQELQKLGVPENVVFESLVDLGGLYLLEPSSIANTELRSVVETWLEKKPAAPVEEKLVPPINPYMNMPIERVRRDAKHGVKLAKEALAVREAVIPEVTPTPEATRIQEIEFGTKEISLPIKNDFSDYMTLREQVSKLEDGLYTAGDNYVYSITNGKIQVLPQYRSRYDYKTGKFVFTERPLTSANINEIPIFHGTADKAVTLKNISLERSGQNFAGIGGNEFDGIYFTTRPSTAKSFGSLGKKGIVEPNVVEARISPDAKVIKYKEVGNRSTQELLDDGVDVILKYEKAGDIGEVVVLNPKVLQSPTAIPKAEVVTPTAPAVEPKPERIMPIPPEITKKEGSLIAKYTETKMSPETGLDTEYSTEYRLIGAPENAGAEWMGNEYGIIRIFSKGGVEVDRDLLEVGMSEDAVVKALPFETSYKKAEKFGLAKTEYEKYEKELADKEQAKEAKEREEQAGYERYQDAIANLGSIKGIKKTDITYFSPVDNTQKTREGFDVGNGVGIVVHEMGRGKEYAVTHINTGLAMGHNWKNRAEAVALAKSVAKITDWSKYSNEKEIPQEIMSEAASLVRGFTQKNLQPVEVTKPEIPKTEEPQKQEAEPTPSIQEIQYSRDLDIRNIEALPKGTGANYLITLKGQGDELIAKQWARVKPMSLKPDEVLVSMTPPVAEKLEPTTRTENLTLKQNITKAVGERPSRISHGYTAKNAFYVTKDNRIIPADEFSQISRGDDIISVHSHSGENWEQYTREHGQESFQPPNAADFDHLRWLVKQGYGNKIAVIMGDGRYIQVEIPEPAQPRFTRMGRKTLEKLLYPESKGASDAEHLAKLKAVTQEEGWLLTEGDWKD